MRVLTIIILLSLSAGCREAARTPVELHPVLGSRCMIVPKGTDIGGYAAPDHGVFMTDDVFLNVIAGAVKEGMEKDRRYH
jgi:hypothetical protein